jgi:hypothetical protein
MTRYTIALLSLLIALMPLGATRADDLDTIRALIGEPRVKIEHRKDLVPSADAAKPPRQRDSWTFVAGGVNPTVCYSRYLNRPPDFTGTHLSLVGPDMGVGFDGGPFAHWYRGNAIRVLLDGRDLLAAAPASRMEMREATDGHLRLIWEGERARRLTLSFIVPRDGRAVFARLEVEPGETPVERLEVRLTAYPGGFGPAYNLPSHRYARTAQGLAEVPPDFRQSGDHPFPVLPLAPGGDWIFYGDRLCTSGSLALLLNADEQPSGEVKLSNYGVSTSLEYPAHTRRIHLAFFAYSLENTPAEQAFASELGQERAGLKSIPCWPDRQ